MTESLSSVLLLIIDISVLYLHPTLADLFMDNRSNVSLSLFLSVWPVVCHESVFPVCLPSPVSVSSSLLGAGPASPQVGKRRTCPSPCLSVLLRPASPPRLSALPHCTASPSSPLALLTGDFLVCTAPALTGFTAPPGVPHQHFIKAPLTDSCL